jgi:hypothetical protein
MTANAAHILDCLEFDELSPAESARVEAIVIAAASAPEGSELSAKAVELIDLDGDHTRGVEILLDRNPDGDYCRPVSSLGTIPELAIRDFVPGDKLAPYIASLFGISTADWWK